MPNRKVQFEETRIDLTSTPVPTSPEYRSAASLSALGIAEVGSNQAVVRRWIPGGKTEDTQKKFIGYGRVEERNRLLSAAGETIELRGNSALDQPIYESVGPIPKETIGLSFSLDHDLFGKIDYVTFWYKMPARIPVGEFGDWHAPITWESRNDSARPPTSMFSDLMNRQGITPRTLPAHAPKIRVRLTTHQQHLRDRAYWQRTQWAVSRIVTSGTAAEALQRHYVPVLHDPIPAC
ncbi:MAG: hypothetical protein V4757_12380 [Pseudomonadota bacterium]